jgi:hypothetical protein
MTPTGFSYVVNIYNNQIYNYVLFFSLYWTNELLSVN